MKIDPSLSIVIALRNNPLAMTIAEHLRAADFNTLVCDEADHALGFIVAKRAALLLLDEELPNDGAQRLIDTLNEQRDLTPILLLEGDNSNQQLVSNRNNICTKPIQYPKLIEQIKLLISTAKSRKIATRRKRTPLTIDPFRFCGGDIDPHRMEVTFPLGHVEKIGRKELGIIAYLRDNPDTVITRDNLIKAIWGDDANTESRSLDQYIVKVRDLYKRHGLELIPFRTVHGVGYIYDTN
jgi:DNA-binding response OmpR family regulator